MKIKSLHGPTRLKEDQSQTITGSGLIPTETLKRRSFCAPLLSGVLISITGRTPLYAHAILVESQPAANGKVKGPTVPVALVFNSRIDKLRSTLTLEAASQQITALPINKNASSPEKLLSSISDAKRGAYKLRWQVLSVDGHITRGQISFEVV